MAPSQKWLRISTFLILYVVLGRPFQDSFDIWLIETLEPGGAFRQVVRTHLLQEFLLREP